MKAAKFKIDDIVLHRPDLYNMVVSKVTGVQKTYQELTPDGKFDPRGLTTLENTIQSFQVPYKIEGDLLTVTIPADGLHYKQDKVSVSKVKGWAYTVTNEKMSSIYSEKSLKKVI